MLAKKIALAAIAGTAMLAASGAYAQDYRYGYRPYYHTNYYRPYRPAPRVVIRTAPRYYYAPPAPVYYAPDPYYSDPYYYAPRTSIYGRVPLGDARIGFRIGF